MGVSNIYVLKTVLWAILAACCILELIFFPSVSNLAGCLVTIVSTWLFFTIVFSYTTFFIISGICFNNGKYKLKELMKKSFLQLFLLVI